MSAGRKFLHRLAHIIGANETRLELAPLPSKSKWVNGERIISFHLWIGDRCLGCGSFEPIYHDVQCCSERIEKPRTFRGE